MIVRCSDLDRFFDGELAIDHASAFRDHLASCESCQAALHDRMQEAALTWTSPAARRARLRQRIERVARYCAGPALAAAAGVIATLYVMRPAVDERVESEAPLELALTVRREGELKRGYAAHAGDVLRPVLRGGQFRAFYVYLDAALQAHCPGEPACHDDPRGRALELELRVAARGTYVIFGARAAYPLPPPAATPDEAAAQLTAAHVEFARTYVDVD